MRLVVRRFATLVARSKSRARQEHQASGFVDEPEPVRAALDDVTARLFEESPLLSLLYRPDGTVSLGPQCR